MEVRSTAVKCYGIIKSSSWLRNEGLRRWL